MLRPPVRSARCWMPAANDRDPGLRGAVRPKSTLGPVIRLAPLDREGAVELLEKDEEGEFVLEGEGRE